MFLLARTALAARRLGPAVEAEYPGRRPIRCAPAGSPASAPPPDSPTPPRSSSGCSPPRPCCSARSASPVPGDRHGAGEAFDEGPVLLDAVAEGSQALGSWLVGVGCILFVTWGRRAYRDASARRTIGILWDVGTFWPRAAHPFAPPCYAERAVPDLTWRMASWTDRTGGRLVISGHSQGSVLAAAAVWQLPHTTRHRVALLTYGSPLERLYGRWFPAYFGREPLAHLHREVSGWRNLWRRTDPIGGPVRLPAGDGRAEVDHPPLRDPLVYGRTPDHPLPEPVLGHGDYQADPAFARERAALLDRLPPAPPLPVPRQRGAGTGGDAPHGDSGRSSG